MTSDETANQQTTALAADTSEPARPQPPLPSVHVRVVITWLAIFPLVTLGMLVSEPFTAEWPSIARAFVLTLVVVPLAVYLVVPQLLRGYHAVRSRRR